MNALNIRPVTDLRNKYPDVESDVQKGPVFFTKNGYGASVLVSLEYFQSHLSRQDLYDHISYRQKPRLMRARDWMPGSRSVGQGHGYMESRINARIVDGGNTNENFADGADLGRDGCLLLHPFRTFVSFAGL